MSNNSNKKESGSSEEKLSFSVEGSWNEIVDVSKKVEELINNLSSSDLAKDLSKKDLREIRSKWHEWRPRESEDYSKEMREKTAEQSCIVGEEKCEEEKKVSKQEIEKTMGSLSKSAEEAKKGKIKGAGKHLVDAAKSTDDIVNSEVKQKVGKIEKGIYEKIILKTNSLYFDNTVLSAVLSKKLFKDSTEKFELTVHSNNPTLRKLLQKKIDWDG